MATNSSSAIPDVQAFKLQAFFTSSYFVPKYQRNYSWTDREVKQLLVDLTEFASSKEDYYLLGEVIVSGTKTPGFEFELIDGQQRATTLLLLFASIYKRLDADPGADIFQKNPVFNVLYLGQDRLRVMMSGDGSNTVLSYLNNSEELPSSTRSQRAIAEALNTIDRELNEKFGSKNNQKFASFVDTVLNRVFLSRLKIENADLANDFFERINDRGLGLGSADLLKNRLFQKIEAEADFDDASEKWSSAEKALMPFGREGTMEYLLRLTYSTDFAVKIKEKSVYDAYKKKIDRAEDALKLVDRINLEYPRLVNVLAGRTPKGHDDPNSQGTRYFRFSQNNAVKLAAAKFPEVLYTSISARLEARGILALLAEERAQVYENLVPKWSNDVVRLTADASELEIATAIPLQQSEIDELFKIARTKLEGTRYGATPGAAKRLRYVLARTAHEVHIQAANQNLTVDDFLTTSRTVRGTKFPGFDIEHISAQSTDELGELKNSLGNLTLLHSQDNQSLGASTPEEKYVMYSHSTVLLTRALTNQLEQTPIQEKVLKPLRVSVIDDGTWTVSDVENRFNLYWSILENALRRDLGTLIPG